MCASTTCRNGIPGAVRFPDDHAHASYDGEAVRLFHRVLLSCNEVFAHFCTGFLGKASPSHFFWGSFDLAVTRFSGRRAPRHPGGVPGLPDAVTREAYSHEVSSAGFWPGSGAIDYPAFYSYAYPMPEGFSAARVKPDVAFWAKELGEFILPYDTVRTASDPARELLAFLQSTTRPPRIWRSGIARSSKLDSGREETFGWCLGRCDEVRGHRCRCLTLVSAPIKALV